MLVVFGISLGEILSNAGQNARRATIKTAAVAEGNRQTLRPMPVQEEGRIKPLETLADVSNSSPSTGRAPFASNIRTAHGAPLKPTEWLLDACFIPEIARHYPVFVVDDPAGGDLAGDRPRMSRAASDTVSTKLTGVAQAQASLARVHRNQGD